MLDVPVAIAMVGSIVGAAVGAMLVFVTLDDKIQRLQKSCRIAAVNLYDAERENQRLAAHNRVLADAVAARRGRPPILRSVPRADLVLDETAESVSFHD